MNAPELFVSLTERGIQLLVDGDRLRYYPRSALTPELLGELRRQKSELLNLLAPPVIPSRDIAQSSDSEANEFYWQQIRETDRRYLLGPRHYPRPCLWCGGRLVHHPRCQELKLSWEPVIPFGRYAGKKVSDVPRNYLKWLVHQLGPETELRAALEYHLKDKRTGEGPNS